MTSGVLQANGETAARAEDGRRARRRRGRPHGEPAARRQRAVHDGDGDEDAVRRARLNGEPFSLTKIAVPAFGPSLLFGLGEGAILPIIPLSVRDLGGSVAVAALIVTLIGIGSLLSNLPASLITDRYGERWAIVGAALWGALAMGLCVVAGNLWLFALGIFMIGMSASVFSLARQSYLTEAVPIHFRARALSTLGGVMRIGLFIGPFLAAALIHVSGLVGAYWIGMAALLLSALVGVGMPDLPRLAAASAGRAAPTIRAIVIGHGRLFLTVGIGVLLVSAVRASRQVVIPLWAEHIGLDAATTSLIYGLAGGIDMLVFYPAGKLMDRKGRNWVAVPSMVIMGVALLLTPLTHGAIALLLASLLIGFGNGIGSGMVMTLGADYSPSPGRAQFLGVWRLLSDLGTTGGPALLSALTAAVSLAAGIAVDGTGRLRRGRGALVLDPAQPRPRLTGRESARTLVFRLCLAAQLAELVLQLIELVVGHFLEVDHRGARAFDAAQQFVELELDRNGVAVLRVLDQEHHQERDDRRGRVHHQLPGVRVVEYRPGDGPDETTTTDSRKAQNEPTAAAATLENFLKNSCMAGSGGDGSDDRRFAPAQRTPRGGAEKA